MSQPFKTSPLKTNLSLLLLVGLVAALAALGAGLRSDDPKTLVDGLTPVEPKLPMLLSDFLPKSFVDDIRAFPKAERLALATFPANDFEPGTGNSLLVFERDDEGRFCPTYKKSYPMKVAARPYQGMHTAYRKVFLRSPVGVFQMHTGSRNGSRYVSWSPATANLMRRAEFVPAFGLKIPKPMKPQKHFHYAVHTVPIGTTEQGLKEKQFSSLGCFSLLVPDMRDLYEKMRPLPSGKRLFVSIYDTISLDPSAEVAYLYKDLYNEGRSTWTGFKSELGKHGLDQKSFNKSKVEKALLEAQQSSLVVKRFFDSLR